VNYPVWELEMGGGLLIALVAVTHVFVSHFAVGGGLFLAVAEARAYRRGDEALLAWLKRHSKFFALLTLVFGAMSGVGIWFTIGLVHPAATSALIHLFVWGWAIEWVFFFVEIASSLVYAATWERLDRRTHLAIGWIYFVSAFMSLVVINGILTFMFTPGHWLVSRSFLDAFFNPTYWPSLVVRTLGCVAFAGLYVLATAWREPPEHRASLARYAAWWAIPATVAGPLAALIYFRAAPGAFEIGGAIPAAAHALKLVMVAAVLYAVLLAAVALLARRRPRLVSLPVGLALLVLGYLSIGSAEFIRESLRKPFVIGNPSGGYLYVNGLTAPEVEATRQGGLLARAKWVTPPSERVGDDRAAGAQIFRVACRGCHTLGGYRAIRNLVEGKPVDTIATMIRTLEKRRGHMPPFPGDEGEQRALARYLASLGGAVEVPAEPSTGEPLAAGKKVMEGFCLSCHVLDGPAQDNPLKPKIKGWSADLAYDNVGKLSKLNAAMIDFDGSDADRRALAAYLSHLGSE